MHEDPLSSQPPGTWPCPQRAHGTPGQWHPSNSQPSRPSTTHQQASTSSRTRPYPLVSGHQPCNHHSPTACHTRSQSNHQRPAPDPGHPGSLDQPLGIPPHPSSLGDRILQLQLCEELSPHISRPTPTLGPQGPAARDPGPYPPAGQEQLRDTGPLSQPRQEPSLPTRLTQGLKLPALLPPTPDPGSAHSGPAVVPRHPRAPQCPTLYNPMSRSTPGLPIHHQLPEFTQTHVH